MNGAPRKLRKGQARLAARLDKYAALQADNRTNGPAKAAAHKPGSLKKT